MLYQAMGATQMKFISLLVAIGVVFTSGTTVQVYQLAHSVRTETWTGSEPGDQS